MKSADVVARLANQLPRLVDQFTTNVGVTSLTSAGTTATATTAGAHGLTVGQGCIITGAVTPVAIATFTRAGTVGTIVTSADHDVTLGSVASADVEGANEAEFNGSFVITGVSNRRTILVEMADAGPTAATGTLLLTNGESALGQYNGAFTVDSVPTTTTFTYTLRKAVHSPALGTPTVKHSARITSAATIDRIVDMYTEDPPGEYWLFVVTGDVLASKSREVRSDAVDNIQRTEYFRQQLTQDVTLYLVVPSSDETSGALARDVAEALFKPICQSILLAKFDSLLTNGALRPLQFVAHGFAVYTSAYYMHSFGFQQVAELGFDDTIGYDEDVAFRDIDLSIGPDLGAGEMTSNIDLDEEPLL